MKRNSYTKRISILALILLSIVAAIWFVMANRFEDFVKKEILPKLEKHEYWVKTDPNSIKIHKYKFSVTTGEIILFPYYEIFSTKTDEIKFCYNPFKKQITAYLTGKKVETGKGDLGFYHESKPSDFISFNQELLMGDFSNMHIKAKDSKTEVKDILKNDLIFSDEGTTYTITGNYNPAIANNYQLGISFEGKGVQYHNPDYFKRLVSYVYKILDIKDPALALGENDLTSLKFTFKEMEIIGPVDAKSRLSLELKKDHFQSIILILKGEKPLSSLAGEFNPLDDLYSLNINQTVKNSRIEDKHLVSLNNDGNKISTNVELSYSKNLGDGQKNELLPLIAEFIYESTLSQMHAITKESPNSEVGTENLVVGDFKGIAAKILNLKNIDLKLSGTYDKTSRELDHALAFKVNSQEVDFSGKGKLKEMVYDGNIKVSDPYKLINSIVDFTETAIYPIVIKATSPIHTTGENDRLKQLINNVKDNGFKALGALNKEVELKPGDSLVTDLHFDPKEFEFKVNNKTFIDIITDERVIPFLKDMPKESEQQHNNEQQPAEKNDVQQPAG